MVPNPVTEPKYIDIKTMLTATTKQIALTGTWLLGFTLLKKLENGRPPSRANAKASRELWAQRNAKLISEIIDIWTESTVAAAKDPVELRKIWKMGTPVGELAASLMSPMQKQTATRNINPVIAPIHTAQIMALGASFRASFISSVMWAVASMKRQFCARVFKRGTGFNELIPYPVIPNAL
jgi:hypothetical protein